MRVFFRRIHLYLAFAAGLVFFVQCLSGTALLFEEEITRALYPARYTVAVPAGQPRRSLADLSERFHQANPAYKILGYKVYADPARTIEISYKDPNARPEGPPGGRGEGRERAEGHERTEGRGADQPRGGPGAAPAGPPGSFGGPGGPRGPGP
ncbi:MAG: PepSY domain-containing protein [Janthinobacterium lividum]